LQVRPESETTLNGSGIPLLQKVHVLTGGAEVETVELVPSTPSSTSVILNDALASTTSADVEFVVMVSLLSLRSTDTSSSTTATTSSAKSFIKDIRPK